MAYSTVPTETAAETEWHHITRALVGGLAAASAMFLHIAVVQTPGLDPPPQTAALFLVAAAGGVISYLLLDRETVVAYAMAALTGVFVLVAVGVTVLGVYGPPGPETNPVGPIAYVLLAVLVIVTSGMSWRSHETGEPGPEPTTAP
ncbi:hypothetical protein C455_02964 [Haloferax larsenii JCM 13917]|nr:hypothetical protein [Haloferax larsenii]ELZ82136.1 hypothetical protein C455_02964 [Haloferax larsenii JCM 13917]